MAHIRRVLTGDDPQGIGRVVVDDIAPRRGNSSLFEVWASPTVPPLPSDGTDPGLGDLFPPAGGVRCTVMDFAPRDETESDDDRYSGFHATDTYDFGFVMQGEIVLVMEDETEVTLRAGDVLVQGGAVHTWYNTTDEPCVVGFVMLGAQRRAGSSTGDAAGTGGDTT